MLRDAVAKRTDLVEREAEVLRRRLLKVHTVVNLEVSSAFVYAEAAR
jgi:hypothetical protein